MEAASGTALKAHRQHLSFSAPTAGGRPLQPPVSLTNTGTSSPAGPQSPPTPNFSAAQLSHLLTLVTLLRDRPSLVPRLHVSLVHISPPSEFMCALILGHVNKFLLCIYDVPGAAPDQSSRARRAGSDPRAQSDGTDPRPPQCSDSPPWRLNLHWEHVAMSRDILAASLRGAAGIQRAEAGDICPRSSHTKQRMSSTARHCCRG